MEPISRFIDVPEKSGWDNVLNRQDSSGKLRKTLLGRTRLHKTPEQAFYHASVLGEKNGTYDLANITKPDGSLKPYWYDEASEEDRSRVSEHFLRR